MYCAHLMSSKIILAQEKKQYLAGMYLLIKITNNKEDFSVLLANDDHYLEPIFAYLLKKEWTKIKENFYQITDKGKVTLDNFQKKYFNFIKHYDIFAYVDLTAGEFAFSQYFEFANEEQWLSYLNNERWIDLRLTIAQFKKIDSIEIVFMNFLKEERFTEKAGWQFDLVLGSLWQEVIEICEQSITIDDLSYSQENQLISGREVLIDIIQQGAKLNKELWSKEKTNEMNELAHEEEYDRYIEDPYYRDNCW